MSLFSQAKPTKTQFNSFLAKNRAAWMSQGEAICEVSKTVVKDAQAKKEFFKHEPTQAAVAYGLTHNLITLEQLPDGYYKVLPTANCWVIIDHLKQTTCAFTGRKVR